MDFYRANLFGYSFVIFLSCQIYSDIHSSNILVTNILGYSFVHKNYIGPTLDQNTTKIRLCSIVWLKLRFSEAFESPVINLFKIT